MPSKAPKTKKTALDRSAPVAREYTVHLHKHLKGEYVFERTKKRGKDSSFKTRAPRAIKAIRQFARRAMFTEDVRIDNSVNRYVYKQGVRTVPHRVRVRLSRRRNEDEEAKSQMYTLVSLVEVADVKGLLTTAVDE